MWFFHSSHIVWVSLSWPLDPLRARPAAPPKTFKSERGDLILKEVSSTMTPDNTHAEVSSVRPMLVDIPGDALDAVVRAGSMLEAAGDFKDAAALYRHFITTLRSRALTAIEPLGSGSGTDEIEARNKELLDWRIVHANPERFTLA